MSSLFWLTDEQFAAIEGGIPMKRRGVKPRRNREVISGIIHVLKIGCRWQDCPPEYGSHTTIYNWFNRWSKAGIWGGILRKLTVHDAVDIHPKSGSSMIANLRTIVEFCRNDTCKPRCGHSPGG